MKEQRALSARGRKSWDLWLFFLLLAALAVLLFRKCRYGFANIDEAFYLTIPLRLIQGDQLMLHEWHLSQLSGFLLAPILRLYLLLAGTTEGMLLAFRRIYTLVQLLAALAIFLMLRPSSKPGALMGALLWCVYAPFGIMALSYNSMGILFVTLSILLHFCGEKPGLLILSGVLFACAVLCCPFLCLVWGAYAFQVLLWPRLRRASWRPDVRKFGLFTLGIAGMAAVFLFFLFRKLSPGRLLEILPLVLKDPEHGFAPVYKLYTFLAFLFLCGRYGCGIVVGYCALTMAGLLCRRGEGKTLCVMGVFLLCAFHLWAMIQTYGYINHLMLPLCYAACACFLIRREETQKPIFYGLLLPCLLYVPCLQLSSNQLHYAMSSASAAAIPAAAVMLACSVKAEPRPGLRRAAAAALAVLFLFQGGAQLHYRWNWIFWEGEPEEQTVLLREGPEAGLLVSEKKAELYEPRFRELQRLNSREKLLFLSENTWFYLCGDWENAAFSAWLSGVNEVSVDKLMSYYRVNPDKVPDLIYVENPGDLGYAQPLMTEYGFRVVQTTELGAQLLRRG